MEQDPAFRVPAADVLGERDTVKVVGPDAVSYLHSQLSQDLLACGDGETCWSFVLDPSGKIDALVEVERVSETELSLATEAGFGAPLLARLNRFKIRVAADLTLTTAASTDETDAQRAARVALGWPRMGAEIIPGETIVAGLGLEALAVSFSKGCYPGQELVERMHSRGVEAPHSLRRLVVDPGVREGDEVFDGDEVVGWLTTVVSTQALGWVKRSSDIGASFAVTPSD